MASMLQSESKRGCYFFSSSSNSSRNTTAARLRRHDARQIEGTSTTRNDDDDDDGGDNISNGSPGDVHTNMYPRRIGAPPQIKDRARVMPPLHRHRGVR